MEIFVFSRHHEGEALICALHTHAEVKERQVKAEKSVGTVVKV